MQVEISNSIMRCQSRGAGVMGCYEIRSCQMTHMASISLRHVHSGHDSPLGREDSETSYSRDFAIEGVGGPVSRRLQKADNKVLKSINYSPADLKKFLG